jgi:hypothetical protein
LWSTFSILVLILLYVGGMMYWALRYQLTAEERGFDVAMTAQPANHAAAIAYSRAITASVTKTSSIYLAFLLIFLGGVYVLMPRRVAYKASGEGHSFKGTLETNSPGLIMITLGVVLAIAALAIKTEVFYNENDPGQAVIGPDSTPNGTLVPRTDYAPRPSSKGGIR